jgi:hypothetical protein
MAAIHINVEEYTEPESFCDQCNRSTKYTHIYIMTKIMEDPLDEDQELVICQYCRFQFNWNEWVDDEENDN